MPTTQQSAVTGKRQRPRYVDIINAQAPYLPYYRELEDKEKWRERGYQLDKERLGHERDIGERTLDLSERDLSLRAKHYRDLEKQSKKARRMGWANIGMSTGLGLADLLSSPELSTEDILEQDYSTVVTEPLSGYEHSVGGVPTPGGTEWDIPFVPEFIENPLEKIWDIGTDIYESASEFISSLFD
jgi:hypothetical protein